MKFLNKILVLTLFASSLCYSAEEGVLLDESVSLNIMSAQKPITLPETVKSLSFDRETNLFDGDILRKAENIAGTFGAAILGSKQRTQGKLDKEIEKREAFKKLEQTQEIQDEITVTQQLVKHYEWKIKNISEQLEFYSSLPVVLNDLFYTLMINPYAVHVSKSYSYSKYTHDEYDCMYFGSQINNVPENAKKIDLDNLKNNVTQLMRLFNGYSSLFVRAEEEMMREAKDHQKNLKSINSDAAKKSLSFLPEEMMNGLIKSFSDYSLQQAAKEIQHQQERKENLWQPMHEFHQDLIKVIKEFQPQ